jgi:cytoskeletal protein RodZ
MKKWQSTLVVVFVLGLVTVSWVSDGFAQEEAAQTTTEASEATNGQAAPAGEKTPTEKGEGSSSKMTGEAGTTEKGECCCCQGHEGSHAGHEGSHAGHEGSHGKGLHEGSH